jgi:hypothetical protein
MDGLNRLPGLSLRDIALFSSASIQVFSLQTLAVFSRLALRFGFGPLADFFIL